jgi:iron complex transport system permease protein
MSGFLSAGGTRLTGARLAATLGACVMLCALVGALAPLLGVDTSDPTHRRFEVLGPGAMLDPVLHDVLVFRLQRVAQSLLVGAALGGAGCALQALLRNPLADPFTLGISSGSSLAAVIAIRIGLEQTLGVWGVSSAALAGACTTLLAVLWLSRIGRVRSETLILAGIVIAMFCSSVSVLIQSMTEFSQVSHMLSWMIGGLDPERFVFARYMVAPIAIGMAVVIVYSRELNALAAGPEVAASLGVAVRRTELVVFAVASLLVGACTAIAGPIGFIGLVVPHVLRSVIGPDHRALVPASMLCGAAVLTVCDTLARLIKAPDLLPAGALTPVLGVPVFMVILIRHRRLAVA